MRFNKLSAMMSIECIVEIWSRVESAWSQHKRLLPMFLRKELPETVPEAWAQEKILTLAKGYIDMLSQEARRWPRYKKRSLDEFRALDGSDRDDSQKMPRTSSEKETLQAMIAACGDI